MVPATGRTPVLPAVAHSQSTVLDSGEVLVAAIRAAPRMSDAESTKLPRILHMAVMGVAPATGRTPVLPAVAHSQPTVLGHLAPMEAVTMTVETTGTCDAESTKLPRTLPTVVMAAHIQMVRTIAPPAVAPNQ